MKKKLIVLFFGVSFFHTNNLFSFISAEASTYENQAVVQFYHKEEESGSSAQNETEEQPSKVDNQNILPQTGSAISSISWAGGILILVVWLVKMEYKEKRR